MMSLLKNQERVSLALAAIFFLSILVSAYMLYSLPANLMLTHGYEWVITKTYLIIAISFALGALAVFVALQNKKELIVFKEKIQEASTTDDNSDSDGQKTTISLEGVKSSLQQTTEMKQLSQNFLQVVCKELDAGQGAYFDVTEKDSIRKITLRGGYALSIGENTVIEFDFGEGLVGQAAAEGRTLYIDDIPEGYIKIISGLGSSSPRYLLIVPVKDQNKVWGVLEIASFTPFSENQRKFVEESALFMANQLVQQK